MKRKEKRGEEMRRKIVDSEKAYNQMQKVYEARGLFVVETRDGKVEAFDQNGVKKHELIYSPEEK